MFFQWRTTGAGAVVSEELEFGNCEYTLGEALGNKLVKLGLKISEINIKYRNGRPCTDNLYLNIF